MGTKETVQRLGFSGIYSIVSSPKGGSCPVKFKAAESSTLNEIFQIGELKWSIRIIMSGGFHGLDRFEIAAPLFFFL